jgi:hypothetical protein
MTNQNDKGRQQNQQQSGQQRQDGQQMSGQPARHASGQQSGNPGQQNRDKNNMNKPGQTGR